MVMITKLCTTCNKYKKINDFYKDKKGKFGVVSICKECSKNYRLNNKEKILKNVKKWSLNNQEKVKKYKNKYYEKNKISILKLNKQIYNKNKDKILEKQKIYALNNKEKIKQRNHNYYIKNRIKILEKQKIYSKINKEKKKKYNKENKLRDSIQHNKYTKDKYQNNINYKITHLLRTRINLALKRNTKFGHTLELLGCSIYFLKKHLESKFTEGMSWDNYGKGINGKGMQEWHIDHIRPCASFDLSKPEEQRKCFHYSNLQPLWAIDNLIKNKY
jgi:hypothetical protein